MYFVIFTTDKPGSQALRLATRPPHREHLRTHGIPGLTVRFAGPTLAENGTAMNGSLLIVEADNLAAVRSFVAKDPYSKAGLFQSVEVRAWDWTLNKPATAQK